MKNNYLIPATALTAACTLAVMTAAHAVTSESVQNVEDGSYISLTGTVTSLTSEGFTVKYDVDNVIEVETDELTEKGEVVKVGEYVSLIGEVEDSWFTNKKIEATSLYVPATDRYYFDPEHAEETARKRHELIQKYAGLNTIEDGTYMGLYGKVYAINDQEFTLRIGDVDYSIDTDRMEVGPLDEGVANPLQVGDVVYVSGEVDKYMFEETEIEAEYVDVLSRS